MTFLLCIAGYSDQWAFRSGFRMTGWVIKKPGWSLHFVVWAQVLCSLCCLRASLPELPQTRGFPSLRLVDSEAQILHSCQKPPLFFLLCIISSSLLCCFILLPQKESLVFYLLFPFIEEKGWGGTTTDFSSTFNWPPEHVFCVDRVIIKVNGSSLCLIWWVIQNFSENDKIPHSQIEIKNHRLFTIILNNWLDLITCTLAESQIIKAKKLEGIYAR